MEALRTRQTWLTLVMQRLIAPMDMVDELVGVACQILPDEFIDNAEIIAVDEDSWNVTEKKDHNNAHEYRGKVDLTFKRISCSFMGKPTMFTLVSKKKNPFFTTLCL